MISSYKVVNFGSMENSSIGKYVYFYKNNNPRDIADTIMKVDDNNYSASDILNKLDNDFKEKVKLVL